MSKETKTNSEGIYDAKVLGKPKMLVLGIQHMFAMFGATVLVPMITGLDTATTLLMAGLGTLFFHLVTKGKVPAFLGSSFAFLGGYAAVKSFAQKGDDPLKMLPYACLGVACAGLVYLILALLIKLVGVNKVMKFFPPVVTGPIIMAIGLSLAPSALNNCASSWPIAIVALAIVIIFNIWGKGMAKIVPIILGVLGAYIVALVLGNICGIESMKIDFSSVQNILNNIGDGKIYGEGGLICLPIFGDKTVFGGIDWSKSDLIVSSIVAIVPIALATMMEHIGDICAIGSTCGKNYIKDPGLHRTLVGDGIATSFASIFGGPANTTYGENTGVLALSKVYDPKVIRIAAYFAICISFFPIVSACISTIPTAVIGGISFVLYGMISAIGVRNVVESKVDFTKSRNLIIAAVILVCALGIKYSSGMGADLANSIDGAVKFSVFGVDISLSALAVASIAGIVLNAILPGKDYDFSEENPPKDNGANLEI